MPIVPPAGLRRLSDPEYRQIAYEVMEIVFKVRNQMGNLFDEVIYQKAIAPIITEAEIEVPITVIYDTFRKPYYLDLLVLKGALFELKTVEVLNDQHRAQLLNYLLLLELPHGKLVNLRTSKVDHEFVNAPLRRSDRVSFGVDISAYARTGQDRNLPDLAVAILRDWGTCLDVQLYEEALAHFFGGKDALMSPVEISHGGSILGQQKLLLLDSATSLCVTTLNDCQALSHYRSQLSSFVGCTPLKAIQWVNIGRKLVTFTTIKR